MLSLNPNPNNNQHEKLFSNIDSISKGFIMLS